MNENKEASPIRLYFFRPTIKPSGHIGVVTITQDEQEVLLSLAQVRSLITQLKSRFGEDDAR